MSLNIPAQTGPGQTVIVGGADAGLVNDLNVVIPDYIPQLLSKYGTENYALLMEMLGKTVVQAKTDTQTFKHFEKRSSFASFQNNATVTGISAGADVTVTVKNNSNTYTSSGTQSPIRVGEVVEIASSGKKGKITAVNKSVNNAHTATITPLDSTVAFTSASESSRLLADDTLLFRGNINAGEASTEMEGLSPELDVVENTTTEIRDDFPITDRGMMEKTQVDFGGSFYYYKLGQRELNKRFLASIDYVIMEGCDADNLGNGSVGTTGVITRAAAAGGTCSYNSGTGLDISNCHEIARSLDFNGAEGECHWLQDIYQRQDFNDAIFNEYNNGAIRYASVGGKEEAAVSYGFKSLHIDGYSFHLYRYKNFSPEAQYHVSLSQTPLRRNFGIVIPQGVHVDAKNGQTYPSFQIVYQEAKPGVKINTWEWGGMADQNRNGDAKLTLSQIAYVGARVFAANQFVTVRGTQS